jgi:hypothetical protein
MENNSESHHVFCEYVEHEPGDNLLGLIGMQVTLYSDNHKRSQVFNNDQDVLFALLGR